MNIKFNCPHCEQSISADGSVQGSQVQCPACSGLFFAPTFGTTQIGNQPKKLKGPIIAGWVMIGVTCLIALIPGLGFATWLIGAPILFITVILGIVALNKGETTQGVLIMLASIIVAPVFLLLAPILATALAVGAGGGASASMRKNPQITPESLAEMTGDKKSVESGVSIPQNNKPIPNINEETAIIERKSGFAMGEKVSFKDSTWIVLEAKDLGDTLSGGISKDQKTEGKFIYVRFKVTNETNTEDQILFSPAIQDSKGRKFEEWDRSGFFLPDGEKGITMEQLPAGLPKTFSSIFEVAKNAEGLSFLARSFEPLGREVKPVPLNFTNSKENDSNIDTDKSAGPEQTIIKNLEKIAKSNIEQNPSPSDNQNEKDLKLAELKGQLASVDIQIETNRTRWQNGVDTINKLTNYKKTPVQEGSMAYKQCLAASQVIQEVEQGAAALLSEKAKLQATIQSLEK